MTSLFDTAGYKRLERIEKGLLQLHARKDMSEAQREVLNDAVMEVMWDDAIHIAAPWDGRVSLCGNWFRNLVALDGPRPGGMAGCWTCLHTAEWLDKSMGAAAPTEAVADPKNCSCTPAISGASDGPVTGHNSWCPNHPENTHD